MNDTDRKRLQRIYEALGQIPFDLYGPHSPSLSVRMAVTTYHVAHKIVGDARSALYAVALADAPDIDCELNLQDLDRTVEEMKEYIRKRGGRQ